MSAAARNPPNWGSNNQLGRSNGSARRTGLINLNMPGCVIATAQSRNTYAFWEGLTGCED
jgi:hypothetical protein